MVFAYSFQTQFSYQLQLKNIRISLNLYEIQQFDLSEIWMNSLNMMRHIVLGQRLCHPKQPNNFVIQRFYINIYSLRGFKHYDNFLDLINATFLVYVSSTLINVIFVLLLRWKLWHAVTTGMVRANIKHTLLSTKS